MKKEFLCLAAVILMGTATCMAQEPNGRPNMAQRTEQMAKQIGLDEAQTKKFIEVMNAARPSFNGERPSREEMEKMRKDRDEKVKAILNEDQFKKYQEIQEEQMKRFRRN